MITSRFRVWSFGPSRNDRKSSTMNFDDTPQEAAFRAEAKAWIGANAPKQYEEELRKSSLGRTALKGVNILEVAKHKGLTMFFLDMKSPGVEIKPIKQGNGASDFNEVYFTDVKIPDVQRLGEVNDGWNVSLTTLMNERMSIGAGVSTGFPELFEFCNSLMLEDGPAIDDRGVRSKLANWAVKASGLKYTSMRAISALSKGERPGPENSIGKLVAGSMVQDVAAYALDLQGAAGVLSGPEDAEAAGKFQAMLLRAPGTRVEGGTDEIMRNIIDERVLGLPGDIRVDKDVPFNKIPTKGRA